MWSCLLCLACCKSLLLLQQLLMLLRRKEKDGWGCAEDCLLLITACDSCWENGHVTLHNLLLLVHQDIPPSEWNMGLNSHDSQAPKDPWQWSNMYVLIYNCLSLEGLTTAQLTRMWCYLLGNFVFLGWGFSSVPLAVEVKLVAITCSSASLFLWRAELKSYIPTRLIQKYSPKLHFTCFNVPKSYFCFQEHSIYFFTMPK